MRNSVDDLENVIALSRHVIATGIKISSYSLAISITKIARIAKTLHKLDEASCNGTIEDEACEKQVNRYRKQLDEVTEELGKCFVIEHQRDPRGATIKIWADKRDGRQIAYFG